MIQKIKIEHYLHQFAAVPLIDVRSPGEYEKGHIPGACSVPLFSNDERAQVGTLYVQHSREKAIELGYQFVTPKLQDFITQSEQIAPNRIVAVHCWRGGMRSAAFAQHLHDNGFETVYLIEGGYKAYRRLALLFFEQPFQLKILGGFTGSGKTHILESLHEMGEQVVDLERLACHKGSAFGGIGNAPQPSVEHFENLLFNEMRKLDAAKPIWIEDESHNIGRVKIPMSLFRQMRSQRLYFLNIPVEARTQLLVQEYGQCDKEELEKSILRIHKRLGGLAVKNALGYLQEGNYPEVAKIALFYYDKSYRVGMNARDAQQVTTINLDEIDAVKNAQIILEKTQSYV